MKMRIKNKEYVWLHKQKLFKIFYTASYLISIVGPLVEACGKNIKQKTTDFIWHPLISLITIGVYIKKIYE